MDYKKIMDGAVIPSYPSMYNIAIENLASSFELSKEMKELLREKREFGLKKYGEKSFQSNLENTLATPTLEHLKEEIVDAYNYTFHEMYKNNLLGKYEHRLRDIILCLNTIWEHTTELSK
jgi:hypothetical protein